MRPSDAEVQKVMDDTGMDRMQAYRHVEARNILRARQADRRREPRG
jgi:hypothetical protein